MKDPAEEKPGGIFCPSSHTTRAKRRKREEEACQFLGKKGKREKEREDEVKRERERVEDFFSFTAVSGGRKRESETIASLCSPLEKKPLL